MLRIDKFVKDLKEIEENLKVCISLVEIDDKFLNASKVMFFYVKLQVDKIYIKLDELKQED